jgi:hypothetical protein
MIRKLLNSRSARLVGLGLAGRRQLRIDGFGTIRQISDKDDEHENKERA